MTTASASADAMSCSLWALSCGNSREDDYGGFRGDMSSSA